jgi:hypothetical protein
MFSCRSPFSSHRFFFLSPRLEVKLGEFGKNTNQLGYAYFKQTIGSSRIQTEIEIEKNHHHKLRDWTDKKQTKGIQACLVGQRGQKKKKFAQYLSHQIFKRMHRILNVGKKITNCTVYP